MSRPIRIAHVALQLDTGGMERLLVEFARHTDRDRFALTFIALGARGRIAAEIESCGWPVRTLGIGPGVRASVLFRLASLFQDGGAHLVHCHNTKPLLYAGPAARLAQVAGVVHTRHGQRRNATPRQDRLFRLAGRCADRVVCVSEDSRRLSIRDGLPPRTTRTIPNGIDLARFRPSGPAPGGPAIFVGRLTPEKDVATLLRAAAIVARQRPDFRLHIAGDGPCAPDLTSLAGALGLHEHAIFLGEVADVAPLLARSSMLVLPSLTEGLPVTVLEAMARALPVVATAVGGTPEAVADGVTGLLVPPREPAALAAAILRLHTDPALARTMGLAGAARAQERFDARTMVSAYESIYLELLTRRTAAAA